ncbi:hypothetical protein HNQ77_000223 [Silvibacterium bohemicum]|uniref:Transposase DDE domain-containing protein n=1 Tax=Silvibacterium bohemicum TaxID=1577686 RepID=A0A841JPD6_9BACT|nr:hypothetical protein [Silvibacterium bohemicum]
MTASAQLRASSTRNIRLLGRREGSQQVIAASLRFFLALIARMTIYSEDPALTLVS